MKREDKAPVGFALRTDRVEWRGKKLRQWGQMCAEGVPAKMAARTIGVSVTSLVKWQQHGLTHGMVVQ